MEHDYSSEVRKIVLSVVEDCSHCREPYSVDDLRIVGRNGNLWVLSVRCPLCQQQAFVAAVVGDHGDDRNIAATAFDIIADADSDTELQDLSFDDEFNEPVAVDDVLDMHRFLDEFNGDFKALFREPRGNR